MKEISRPKSLVTPSSGYLENKVSQDARRLTALSQEYGWNFNVLGRGPLPTQPVRAGDWLIIPAHLDSSPIPAGAMQRLQAIFSAGIQPKGFVVVHEAPKLLPSPIREMPGPTGWLAPHPKLKAAFKMASYALGILAAGIVAVSGALVMAFALAVLAGVALIPWCCLPAQPWLIPFL